MSFLKKLKGEESSGYKQCIIIRSDLKLSKGQTAVQASHAAILAFEKSSKSAKYTWMQGGQKKVALVVGGVKELFSLKDRAEKLGISSAVVVDAGLTEIPPGTVTALGLGPEKAETLDKITGDLKLL